MSDKTFSVKFDSELSQAKSVIADALQFLSDSFPDLPGDTVSEIKLVICEALFNAIEHGNDGDSQKKVWFSLTAQGESSITIQIIDEGEGFDYNSLMHTDESGLLRESGRGVKLMYSLADNVCYNKKGNKLEIFKKVTGR